MWSDVLDAQILALFEAPSVGFALFDDQLRYLRINELLAAINGKAVSDHLGRTVEEVLPDYASVLVPHLTRVRDTGETIRAVDLPGERISARASFFPARLENGQRGVAVVCTEGSSSGAEERLRFERALGITSGRLVDVAGTELDEEIRASLERMGSALGASHAVLLERDGLLLRRSLAWSLEGTSLSERFFIRADDPLWRALASGEHAVFGESVPPRFGEAVEIVAPMRVGSDLFGALVCCWGVSLPSHTPFRAARVRLLADLVGAAMHRRETERLAADRLRFECLLAEVSSRLLGVTGEGLMSAIHEALGSVAADRGVERAYLYEVSPEDAATLSYEWCAPGVTPRRNRHLPLDRFPAVAAALRAGRTWFVDDVEHLDPSTMGIERTVLEASGIRAQLLCPLRAEERLIGALGLDILRGSVRWSPVLLARMQLIGQMFTSAMVRAQSEREQREDHALDSVVASISASFIEAPSEGFDTVIDAALERLRAQMGLVRAVLIDADLEQGVYRITHQTGELAGVPRNQARALDELGPPTALLEDGVTWVKTNDLDPVHPVSAAWKRAGVVVAALFDIRRSPSKRTVIGLHAPDDGARRRVERRRTIIAELLGNALARRDAEEARREAEEAQRRAFAELAELKNHLERERDYLREEEARRFDPRGMIAESPAMRGVLDTLDAVAPTSATVLIRGESGVGKELVARALHLRSQRAEAALVRVNCASVPRELFESEFFGHVRGSFTGAHRDRAGRFELADGGTLFLDEVGEIPLDLQAKLLRVLQEGEFERVGEDRVRRVDVRIVAATNRDLEEEVEAGRFRRDLYYRLSAFPLLVPPLRERIEDIAPLAKGFLSRSAREVSRTGLGLSPEQLRELERHDWPGNVRELAHVIERAVILSTRSSVLRLDLAMPRRRGTPSNGNLAPREERASTERSPSEKPAVQTAAELRALERANLLHALEQAQNRVAGPGGAAELLGLSPSTVRDRMRVFGLLPARTVRSR